MASRGCEPTCLCSLSFIFYWVAFYLCWLFTCIMSNVSNPSIQNIFYIISITFWSISTFLLVLSIFFLFKDIICPRKYNRQDLEDEKVTLVKKGDLYLSGNKLRYAYNDIHPMGPLAILIIILLASCIGFYFYIKNIISTHRCLDSGCEKICNDDSKDETKDSSRCSSCPDYFCCCKYFDDIYEDTSYSCVSPLDECGQGLFQLIVCIIVGVTGLLLAIFILKYIFK